MQIKCEMEDLNGNKFFASAANMRQVVFTHSKLPDPKKLLEGHKEDSREVPQLLLVSGDEFLNNFSFFQ